MHSHASVSGSKTPKVLPVMGEGNMVINRIHSNNSVL